MELVSVKGNLKKNREKFKLELEFVTRSWSLMMQDTYEPVVHGEEKIKKEELHFKVKSKSMEPDHDKEEMIKVELELKTKSVEKVKPKHMEEEDEKHKEKD
ncbi:uncharacterized protein [Gossypium hirsutum]|uniref:Uncharacterized protein n=1 Tax=Gossypium hirsutum TaxID=3635 RepID=A0ABM3AJ12_GOSHI|nr:uncharacterized protein LOC107898154 [Gossypium hirsutum]